MKKLTHKSNQKGFTIIEVLIVLAIAGLIMLVVFLAVPALQRNARNSQRKTDISNLLAAVSEYSSNNNGDLPVTAQFDSSFAESNPKIGYYKTAANIQWTKGAAATAGTAPADFDKVSIYSYSKCSDAKTATVTGATQRSIVALYTIEGSGGAKVAQCQEM